MSFNITEAEAILIDPATGNVAGYVLDGSIYRLQTETKLATGHGLATEATLAGVTTPSDTQPISAVALPLPAGAATQATLATLATETKLEAVRVLLASLDGKDFATQTTLATLLTQTDFAARVGEVQATPTANTLLARLKDLYDTLVARLGTLGQKTMANSSPVVVASDQSPVNVQLTDAAGTKVGVEDAASIPAGTDGLLVMGTDSGGLARRLLSTNDGRLVVNSAVSAPPNKTAVAQGTFGDVTTEDDAFYTIPTGETLYIQRFASGSEETNGGSSAELYYAPNGNTTGLELIRVIYSNGNSTENSLEWGAPAVGDGTRAILLRRRRLSGGAVEIGAFWDGYY